MLPIHINCQTEYACTRCFAVGFSFGLHTEVKAQNKPIKNPFRLAIT
jgi:short-subunit dehydrogenase